MEYSVSRKEQEKEARKLDIIAIAAQMFAEKDFYSVTVDEIAEKVGLSKGTIYLYFENKEALFFSILVERFKSLMKILQAVILEDRTFLDSLHLMVFTILKYMEEHRSFFKIIHSEKTRSFTDAHYQMHEYTMEMMKDFIKIILQLLERGVQEKCLRNIPVTSMGKMLGGLINAYVFNRIFFNTFVSPEEEAVEIVDLFLNGVKQND